MIRTFGQYSTSRDLFRRGFCTVSATDVGEENFWGAKPQAVKAMAWPEPIVSRSRASDWIEEFVESAELQRAMAGEGAAGWAPIHAVARTEQGGAYYVTDIYQASARLLAAGRYQWSRVNSEWLRGIVLGVLSSLEELQNRRGRAHGNLRPGNVLLDNIHDLSEVTVALVDPATSGQIVRMSHGEHEDMRDLGLVLHQLILHVPFRELGGWPLVDSEAWRVFGEELGDAWRELVSWLIDPKAESGTRTIAECRQRVMGLPKAKAPVSAMRLARRSAIAAAAIGALGFGGWQAYIFTRPFDAEAWGRYVSDYTTWAGPLLEDAQDPDNPRLDDPRLGNLRRVVLGGANVLDLDNVLGQDDATMGSTWADTPPEEAQRQPVPYRTGRAVAKLDEIRALVESDSWALRDELLRAGDAASGTLVDGVGERWPGLAAYARDIESRLGRFDDELPLESALTLLDQIEQVDETAESLQSKAERFVASGDEFLDRFADVVNDTLDSARDDDNVEQFVSELRGDAGISRDWVGDVATLDEAAAQVESFLDGDWSRVDQDYLWSLEEYRDLADLESPDANGLDVWLELASDPGYVKLDPAADPRDGTLDARIARLTEQASALRESPALVERLETRLDDVESAIAEDQPIAALAGDDAPSEGETRAQRTLAEHIEYTGELYWVTEQREAVEQWASATASIVESLEAEVQSISNEERRIAQDYVDDLRAETTVAVSDAVNAEWLSRRDALLAEYDADGVLRSLVDRADAARKLVARIDGSLTAPDEVVTQAEPSEWDGERLLERVRAQREEQLSQVVAAIDWSLEPEALSAAVDARLTEQQGAYNAWQARVADLVADMARAESLMATHHLPEDQPADGGATLAAIFDAWSNDAVVADVSGREVFDSIYGLHARVVSVSDEPVPALASIAGDESQPGVVSLGAWRRLGEGGQWPTTIEQLTTEAAIRERVSAIAAETADGRRRAEITAELDEQGQARWLRLAGAARSDADIEAALALEDAFGVDRSALDARTRYNTALAELRLLAGDEFLEQDEQVEAGIREFISLAQQGGAYSAQAARMQGVLREAASKPETINLDEYGPALVGWEVTDVNRRQTRVTFTSPNGMDLRFALVRPRGSDDVIDRPLFMTTSEVSLGMARELLNAITGPRANKEADDLRRDLEEGFSIGATVGVNWEGPRGWAWSDLDLFRLGLLLNQDAGGDGWLWVNQFADQYALIAPEIAPDQTRPTFAHPLNHVSPAAADMLCSILRPEGASEQGLGLVQLPTAEQWQAAYAYHEAAQGAEDRLWNLRDATWGVQQAHARDVRRQLGGQATFFQFPDSGIYLPEDGQSIPTGESATLIERSEPDGVLWFAPVRTIAADDGRASYEAPGSVLKHMIGNVAEIVRVEDGSGFAVIGGSAMSPPELDLIEPSIISRGFNQLERSYSDVGFRMSFETEDFREPMSVLLGDALEGMTGDYN